MAGTVMTVQDVNGRKVVLVGNAMMGKSQPRTAQVTNAGLGNNITTETIIIDQNGQQIIPIQVGVRILW